METTTNDPAPPPSDRAAGTAATATAGGNGQAAAPPPVSVKPPAISTRNLTKRFGALTALENLSLELEAGDIFGFIGPNGAGNSTTMKILAGLMEPTSGSAA